MHFDRVQHVEYEVHVAKAINLRGGELWVPFTGTVKAASAGAVRPIITAVQGGLFHQGAQGDITIAGSGFADADHLRVLIDNFELTPEIVDQNTLKIPAGAVDMLNLDPGQHHLRVRDRELEAGMPGAIIIGAELDLTTFAISPQSGSDLGGPYIHVTASQPAILPGAKVILRSRHGREIRTFEVSDGIFNPNLHDDVQTMTSFQFMLPGVETPDLYDVYLSMADGEVKIGQFSYTMAAGRGIDLPNYPPMQVGAMETRGDTLFVGVKNGTASSVDNRFLMKSGLENL